MYSFQSPSLSSSSSNPFITFKVPNPLQSVGGVYTVTANNEEGEDVAVIVLDIVGQSPQFVGSFNNLTLPHLTPHLIRGLLAEISILA